MKAGEVVAERFEIERLAGSGGMGAVYRAKDRLSGEPCAVKILYSHYSDLPEHAERFTREAKILQELTHPGIVRYIAHGRAPEGQAYLALEWLEGESLTQRLRRKGLTIDESLEIARRVADALAAAHRRGIVHRDLKPSNLFLPEGSIERLKVLDFGIAKTAHAAPLTVTGVVVGTPFYMSPEQARGEKRITPSADVFALGCVLFHCLIGKAPFAGEELHAALLKVVLEEAPRLSDLRDDIPPELDALVARMLTKNPEQRFADAGSLLEALEGIGPVGDTREPVPSSRAVSITGREMRVVCAVLARLDAPRADMAVSPTLDMTLPSTLAMGERPPMPVADPRAGLRDALRSLAERHQGSLEQIDTDTILITLAGATAATDQAARAARCALAVRLLLPGSAMALVAGRGVMSQKSARGEVVDRGNELLELASAHPPRQEKAGAIHPIRVDDAAAGLLGARFEIGGDKQSLLLLGDRQDFASARTLLGRPTPIVGRDHELAILDTVLDEVASEPTARAVLVTAPAGVGKSRLTQEFIRRARESEAGPQIWAAQGDPMSAGSPFGLLAQMLRREAGLREGEPREVRKQKLRARLGRHLAPADLPRVSWFLGELAGVPFSDKESVELRAARSDPMLMGDQMRRAWEDLLLAESAAAPLVIILEDLHWGDLPTVKFIDAALRGLQDRPIMVLGLGRPEVFDLFPRLWSERGVQQIHLRELSRRGSERLVREVLGAGAPAGVVARIAERAAGNAFYLEELIRAAAEGHDEDLPESVLAMVQARLEGLHAEARRVLRAASVFGQVFWRGGLVPLLGGDAALLGDWLRELCERELITRRGEGKFPGEDEYTFRHGLVRDAAYAMLTEADSALGHRLAAAWLEQAGEREALILAEHFERGGEPEKAVAWFKRAAEQALGGNDFEAAIARAERGAAYASGEILAQLRLLQAEAYKWMGLAAEAESAALAAMERFAIGSAPWFVAASEVGSMRLRLGLHEGLSALAEEVLASGLGQALERASVPPEAPRSATFVASSHGGRSSSIPPGPTMGMAISALARLSGSLLHDGQHELAERLIAEIDRVAAPIAERDGIAAARLYALHASRALCYGDPAASLYFTELSIPSFAFMGDRRNACLGRVNAGHAMIQLGAFEQAERALRSALTDAERMGLGNVSAFARQNLGLSLAMRGELSEACAVELEAIKDFEAQQNRRQEGRARAYLAEILIRLGDLEAAEAEAQAALERLATIPPLYAGALGVLARVRIARGKPGPALEAAAAGMKLTSSLRGMEEGETLLRLVYAEALALTGQTEAAREAFAFAKRRLLERAGRIKDPALAESFCRNVPESVRTFALAESVGTLALLEAKSLEQKA